MYLARGHQNVMYVLFEWLQIGIDSSLLVRLASLLLLTHLVCTSNALPRLSFQDQFGAKQFFDIYRFASLQEYCLIQLEIKINLNCRMICA
jgi:hypothetical protein